MKTRLFVCIVFCVVLLMLFVSSCVNKHHPGVVRIAFEELQEGVFYSGSLMFDPSDPSYSHLHKGTLIAFQDITYGWEDIGDDVYVPIIIKTEYGYMYIRDVHEEYVEYEYLLYGPDGRIVEREDSVFLSVAAGEADFSSASENAGFCGIAYHTGVNASHSVISNSYLLSFIHEIPETVGEEEIIPQEEYRRVVFRIQQAGITQTSHYPKGVVAISASNPKSHVVNSSFHHRVINGATDPEDEVVFLKTGHLPEFAPGDFILDAEHGVVRKIESVDDSDPSQITLGTTKANLVDALGTIIIKVEGDLSEIVQKHAARNDLFESQNVRVELLNLGWAVKIVNLLEAHAQILNSYVLYADVSISLHKSIDKFNSSGRISFPMTLRSVLEIDAMVGFEKEDSHKLVEPGITFTLSGIPITISMPIYAFYEVSADLAQLEFEFGPELKLELGFNYDVGAEVRYGSKALAFGVHAWGDASGIFGHSEDMVLDYKYDTSPRLSSKIGLKAYPGVTIACVFRPDMEIPFDLHAFLEDDRLKLDLEVEGHMEMRLDMGIYKHTWRFGKVFGYTRHLYEKELW